MRLLVLFTVAAAVLCFSPATKAATITGYVERIYPNGEYVNFRLKDDQCKLSGSAGNTYWRFRLSTEVEHAWFSMLLAAAHNKSKVRISVPSCTPQNTQIIRYLFIDVD